MAPSRTFMVGDPAIPAYGSPGYFDINIIFVTPPPGVTANFNAANPNGSLYVAISIILLSLAIAATGLRMYTKTVLIRALGWDDYTCVLSLIGLLIFTGVTIKMAFLGEGKHSWNVNDTVRERELHNILNLTQNSVYFWNVCLVKLSMLFTYLRTFPSNQTLCRSVYAIMFIIVSTHFISLVLFWTSFTPFNCYWRVFPSDDAWNSNCKEHSVSEMSQNWYLFMNAFTVALDLVILILPCRPIWRLNMARRQKLVVLGIFAAGIVVTIASTMRLAFMINRFFYTDDDWFTNFEVLLSSIIEANIAVICICLPSLKAFIKRYWPLLMKISSNKPSHWSRSNLRSKPNASSAHHHNKLDRKWATGTGSGDEELTRAAYVELGEDGKSDQSYAMTGIEVKTDIDIQETSQDRDQIRHG